MRTGTGEDRKVSAVHSDWNNRAACWRKEGDIDRDRLRAICGISWIQGGTHHCASIGRTAEGCHQRLWQFPSPNEMQKSHSFANYKMQRPKFIIPSMRFIETKLFKNPPRTTGVSDLKIIKNHKKMIAVVGMQCQGTTKCSQKPHSAEHSKSHFLYWNSLSLCRMPFGGGKKNPAKWSKIVSCTTTCLVKLPLQCSSFWCRTKLHHPPTTLSTRSHSTQLPSPLKAQVQTQKSSFYICRINSTEYCSMSQNHIKRWLPETLPTTAWLLEQAVRAEARCFQCDLSYILYTSILVWIMTTFQEVSNLPT